MEIKTFKSNSMYVLESDINKFIHGMPYDSLQDEQSNNQWQLTSSSWLSFAYQCKLWTNYTDNLLIALKHPAPVTTQKRAAHNAIVMHVRGNFQNFTLGG